MPESIRDAHPLPGGPVRGAAVAARHVPRRRPGRLLQRAATTGRSRRTRPNPTRSNQPPYYVLASPPDELSTTGEFQLTIADDREQQAEPGRVHQRRQRPGPNYGKITVLEVPHGDGDERAGAGANIFNDQPDDHQGPVAVQRQRRWLLVVHGNLLTLPIGESFLYVEPLYVQGTAQNNGSFPILRGCWSSTATGSATPANLPDALTNLSQGAGGHLVDQRCEHHADRHAAPRADSVAVRQPRRAADRLDHAAEPTLAVLLRQVDQALRRTAGGVRERGPRPGRCRRGAAQGAGRRSTSG